MLRKASTWVCCFSVASVATFFVAAVGAQDRSQGTDDAPAGSAARDDESPRGSDPFALPKNATPARLVKFIEKVESTSVRTLPDAKKKIAAMEQAGGALLAAGDTDDAMVMLAVRTKLSAYEGMHELELEDAAAKLDRFLKSLRADKRPAVALVLAEEAIKVRAGDVGGMTRAERRQLIDDTLEHIRRITPGIDAVRLAHVVADALEEVDSVAAADAYDRFGQVLAKSPLEEVREHVASFAGVSRRLRLPGNPIDIEGTTLDGRPFNIKKLEGKVVLIDFWATWCGPCVAELPEVKKLYARYHAKGFEVVGISLDESKSDLEDFVKENELPWPILYSAADKGQGWGHPMASKYGIMGIPTGILVDRKGKVIELKARGERLAAQLEKLFGPIADNGGSPKATRRE